MDRSEIETKVIEVVALQFGIRVDEINLKTRFQEDLGADSLDAVELVMGAEDRFNIRISDEESYNLLTVEKLVDYVQERLQNNSS